MAKVTKREHEELRPAMRSGGGRGKVDRFDAEDREVIEARLKAIGAEFGGCDPEAVEITFMGGGGYENAVIFIPDPNQPGRKLAYALRE